jgi:DNA modification methylase
MEMSEELKLVDIDKLVPYARNSRTHSDEQIKQIQASIREFGFVNPVLIDGKFNIIAGHGRILAAKAEGIEKVPCVFVSHLTEAQKKAYMLADNKLALNAGWDMEMLKIEIEELQGLDFDLSLTGFDDLEISAMFDENKEVVEDDFDVDAAIPEEPITKLGDVWLLGKHRLACGDSTSGEVFVKLMAGQEADLVLTDPPYNVDYVGKTKDSLKIENDKMQDEQFLQFLTDAFTRMYEHSKKGAAIYIFHSDSEGYNFRTAFKQAGYSLRQCLIWVKNSLVMGRQDYQWKHEPILYGWKDGASHAWYADRKQTTLVEFDRPQKSAEHPTMKPIGLCGYFIANSSKEGDIVLDTFGGSGSTLIACEQIGRTCYIVELDEKYCDVIIKRYETFTGEKAVLLNE